MPDFRLTIDGTERKDVVQADSLNIRERDGIAYAEFAITDRLRVISIADHAEVIVYDWPGRIFGGYVADATPVFIGRTREWRVKCQDYNAVLDEDVIPSPAYRSASEQAGQRVTWLFNTFGTKGLTAATYVQNVAAMPGGADGIPEQDFGGKTFREALDYICRLVAASYHVDFQKEVHFYSASGEALGAPFHISDTPNNSTTFPHVGLARQRTASEYRNAVYIRGKSIEGWWPDPPPAAATRRAGVIRDEGIESAAQIASAGAAYLAGHVIGDQVTCQIVRPGLHTGMALQVTSDEYGLVSAPYMVREVITHLHTNLYPYYDLILGTPDRSVGQYLGGVAGTADRALEEATAAAAGGAGGQPVADLTIGGANLVPNSSFENKALSGWTQGTEWVWSYEVGALAAVGTKIARAQPVAATVGNLDSPLMAVDRTDDYWISAWLMLRAWTSGTAVMELLEYSAADVLLATTTVRSAAAADAAWLRPSIRMGPNNAYGRTPWQATTAKIRLRFRTTGVATLTYDVDGVQVERSDILTAYAPQPYEIMDSSVVASSVAGGAITSTAIADDAITTPKLATGAVIADKIAASAITAGKIAAGAITSAHISTVGLDADLIRAGTLRLGGGDEMADVLIVYDAQGDEIGRWGDEGLLLTDAGNPLFKVRLLNGRLEFASEVDGSGNPLWQTAITAEGITADAIRLGSFPGGSNRIPNAGYEMAMFNQPSTNKWPTNSPWSTTIGTDVNVTKGATLQVTTAAY